MQWRQRGSEGTKTGLVGASNWLKGHGAVSGSVSAAAHQRWHSNPLIGLLTKREGGRACLCNARNNTSPFLLPPLFLLSACINLPPLLLAFYLSLLLFSHLAFSHTPQTVQNHSEVNMFVLGTHYLPQIHTLHLWEVLKQVCCHLFILHKYVGMQVIAKLPLHMFC